MNTPADQINPIPLSYNTHMISNGEPRSSHQSSWYSNSRNDHLDFGCANHCRDRWMKGKNSPRITKVNERIEEGRKREDPPLSILSCIIASLTHHTTITLSLSSLLRKRGRIMWITLVMGTNNYINEWYKLRFRCTNSKDIQRESGREAKNWRQQLGKVWIRGALRGGKGQMSKHESGQMIELEREIPYLHPLSGITGNIIGLG